MDLHISIGNHWKNIRGPLNLHFSGFLAVFVGPPCNPENRGQSSPKIMPCAGLESVEEISVGDLMSQPPTPSWGAPGLLKGDGPRTSNGT